MALKKAFELDGETVFVSPSGNISMGPQKMSVIAYCKIASIAGNKETASVMIECSSDKCRFTKQAQVPLSVADDAPNFIKQAYLHLKTMPEWADAVDC